MAKRKAISQKVRFEVFKRDKFTCQYCGQKAPDVILHCDHIRPVAGGGKNDILNLITACLGCNQGKGAKVLSDGSSVERQREQIATLEERRQQIAMMLEWRDSLAQQNVALLDACAARWSQIIKNYGLSEIGRAQMAGMIKKRGFSAVLDAIDAVGARFPNASVEKPDALLAERMFVHLKSIIRFGTDEDGQRLAYIFGIIRNRCTGQPKFGHANLRAWHEAGISIEMLKETALAVSSWSAFIAAMDAALKVGERPA
ncbi:HNHc domain containing protein [uncultured Caudovirales phage]|uniref:HNHc domain containing protein n=1 Tax=uncultured Caudovirales phage TaxID=2100421 RepID=A0A6J5P6F1_9CAUD|nr:HNHc domain containing protein [uncultured Caudovirales phage]CAB4218076.1 HNHc domain containing protein [uncultured Caudovirales phage]